MAARQTTRTRSRASMNAPRSAGGHRRAAHTAHAAEVLQPMRKTRSLRLRVPTAEAHQLRSRLLSDQVNLLSSQDIRRMVTILEDVYPIQRQRRSAWPPLLIGMGIGLLLVVGIMLAR